MGQGFVSKPGSTEGDFTRHLEHAQVFDTMREAFEARTGMQRVIPVSELNKDKK
jgi:hypothetical protein